MFVGFGIHKTGNLRGFSLIEAAIVLGIIALVVGGIWTAASSVRERRRISETYTGVIESAYNLKRTFNGNTVGTSFANWDAARLGMTPDNMHALQLFPERWWNSACGFYDVPFSHATGRACDSTMGTFGINTGTYGYSTYNGDMTSLVIQLNLNYITRSACIELVQKFSQQTPRLFESVSSDSLQTFAPITLQQAAAYCPPHAPNSKFPVLEKDSDYSVHLDIKFY